MSISAEQYATLMKPLNASRVANRSQGGKQLSYLESYDVRAHLIRIFGFGNFDVKVIECNHITDRNYESQPDSNGKTKAMVEVIYFARVELVIRVLQTDAEGMTYAETLCTHIESAVGSASGPENMLGEHHDNAAKTAASDALKRCAINLGSQFGLSLYNNGTLAEVVKGTLVKPVGVEPAPEPTEEQVAALANSLGATVMQPEEASGEQ